MPLGVLKTVGPKGPGGSNPSLSANQVLVAVSNTRYPTGSGAGSHQVNLDPQLAQNLRWTGKSLTHSAVADRRINRGLVDFVRNLATHATTRC